MAKLSNYFVPSYCKSGIYAVINKSKMIAYVGQSTNIKRRAEQHKSKILNSNHEIEDINKDGDDEFIFLVLHKFYNEDVSKEKLVLYEKLYMLTLVKNGFRLYNKNDVGDGSLKDISWRICTEIMSCIETENNLRDAYMESCKKHYSFDVVRARNKRK